MNPGPIKYPCTVCLKSVKSNHKALLCDNCQLWSHSHCVSVSDSLYHKLLDAAVGGVLLLYCQSYLMTFLTLLLSHLQITHHLMLHLCQICLMIPSMVFNKFIIISKDYTQRWMNFLCGFKQVLEKMLFIVLVKHGSSHL